jgi:hypothetical protein
MGFKPINRRAIEYTSPEALFNDCKKRKFPGLLSHQADVLRIYQSDAIDKSDVAFQMPTGSGKTLVGVLLAEWRRRSFNNRPLYLAPTKQLAYQVANEAREKYDIRIVPLVGKKSAFPPEDRGAWQAGEVLAVTTFSGLFNANPEFKDPDVIIVDDAHAAENYFAKHWSVSIDKRTNPNIWKALAALLKRYISVPDHKRLIEDPKWPTDLAWIDKLPTPMLAECANDLTAILDEHLSRDEAATTEAWYAWSNTRDSMLACHLYISATEISLRPIIAPTFSHAPFSSAKQRIYMSATLGQGGELERLCGRRSVHRIPVPPAWEKQGLGRRLFLFPSRSLDERQEEELLPRLMQYAPRRAILTPSTTRATEMTRVMRQELPNVEIFDAKQIERDKSPFVKSSNGIAVLANRYDGIDFSDDDCRLLVIDGLPKAINLQERFIMARMGAAILLNDRMMTRIIQAFGRCTRSATDYSVVVVLGDEVLNILVRRDKRALLHPELQAEIEFGLEQSANVKGRDFEKYIEWFLRQGDEWANGEEAIKSLRADAKQTVFEAAGALEAGVQSEVEYQESMWSGDYEGALSKARQVLTHLKCEELRGYRCLWNYLAGSAAFLATKINDRNLGDLSKQFFWSAGKESSGISWLKVLARYTDDQKADIDQSYPDDSIIERLETFIEKVGTSSVRRQRP